MLICRNAEEVHGQRKVGNPWYRWSDERPRQLYDEIQLLH